MSLSVARANLCIFSSSLNFSSSSSLKASSNRLGHVTYCHFQIKIKKKLKKNNFNSFDCLFPKLFPTLHTRILGSFRHTCVCLSSMIPQRNALWTSWHNPFRHLVVNIHIIYRLTIFWKSSYLEERARRTWRRWGSGAQYWRGEESRPASARPSPPSSYQNKNKSRWRDDASITFTCDGT